MFCEVRLAIFCLPLAQRAAPPARCSQLYHPGVEAAYPLECGDAAEEQTAVKVLQAHVSRAVEVFQSWVQNAEAISLLELIKGLRTLEIMQYLFYHEGKRSNMSRLLLQYYATGDFLI